MAERNINIDKDIQVNPQTKVVRGKIWCMENNRLLGEIEFRANNWEDFELVLGAAQKIKDVYGSLIQRPGDGNGNL